VQKDNCLHVFNCFYSKERGIIDESDQFMSNPAAFVKGVFSNSHLLNFSHIVLFESEEKHLRDLLSSHFVEVK
jgi:GPI mannosyltransferase 3